MIKQWPKHLMLYQQAEIPAFQSDKTGSGVGGYRAHVEGRHDRPLPIDFRKTLPGIRECE